MSRTKRNALLVEEIFKPDDKGNSEWKTRDEIDLTGLKLCKNGNIRHNIPWTDKYIWEIIRINNKPRGKPIRFRTIGLSKNKLDQRPINNKIREKLLNEFKNCRHCAP